MKNSFTQKILLFAVAGLMVVNAWGDPTDNIAIGKTAVSGWTSAMGDNEKPGKAVDNSTTTQWVAWGANGVDKRSWFGIDLGEVYSLTEFAAVWRSDGGGGDVPSHYLIQVASALGDEAPADFVDDATYGDEGWTTVAEVNETQVREALENRYSFNVYPVRARYVRLVSVQNLNVALSEFRLFSDGNSAVEVTPTLTSATSSADIVSGSTTLTLTATDHNGDPLKSFVLQDHLGAYYYGIANGSNQITISGLDDKRYIFTAWAVESGYRSEGRTIVVGENTFSPSTNYALDKPAYAVKYAGTDYPKNANDGRLDNLWKSAEPVAEEDRANVWWYVDLQDQFELKYVDLFWEGAYATRFILQIRKDEPTLADAADDSQWTTFLDYTGDQTDGTTEESVNKYGDVTGAKAAFSIVPKGRYVRIRMVNARNWGWGVKLREMRIFANGYLTLDNTAPVISEASYNGVTADYLGVKFNVATTDDQTDPVTEYIVVDQNSVSHDVTVDEGVITVTDMPTGKNVNVTIYALDEAGNRSAGEVVNITYLRPDENLALSKTTYACVHLNDGEGKAMPVDGNTSTAWTSYSNAHHDNDWWYVDLGDFYDIRRIEVVWQTDRHSTDFSVQYRQNAPSGDSGATEGEWNDITEFSGKSGDQAIDITNTQARYLCMRSKAYGDRDPAQVRMAEFRVYGKAFATPDLTAPTITTAEVAGDSENVTSVKLHIVAEDNKDDEVKNFFLNKGDDNWLPFVTDGSDCYTVSDLARGHYSYQVKAIDKAENISAISTINFDIFNPADNLALNKDVVAGYTPANVDEAPAKVNDGNYNLAWTTWNDRPMSEQWWSVDLGDVYQLSNVDLFWGEALSNHYIIQVAHAEPADRADDTQWYTVLEVDETQQQGKTEEDKNRYALNASARYVRFKAITKTSTFLRLWELRVFGTGFAAADKNVPVISTASVNYNNDGKAYMTLVASDTEDGAITLFRVTNTTTGLTQMLTTNGSNQLVFDDLDLETSYNFEIQAMDKAANLSTVSEIHVFIPTPTTNNIALEGIASAGYNNPGEEASKANDGLDNTQWVTWGCENPADMWWEIELNGLYHLTKVAVLWNDAYYASKYTIMTRKSINVDWTPLPQVTVDEPGLKETDVDVEAAYVRIVIDQQAGAFTRMHEVQLFADAKSILLKEGNNAGALDTYNGETIDIALERAMPADGYWYTLCLPFDMSADEVTAVFGSSTIAEMTGAEDRGTLIHLNFNYVNAIEAGHPYLFKPGNDFAAGTIIEGVTINNVTPIVAGDALMHFQGIYDATTLTGDNIRFVGDDDYLYSPRDGGTPIGAFRCYFTIPDGSPAAAPGRKAKLFFGDENPTGMDQISEKAAPAKIMMNGVLYIIRDGRTYNAQGIQIK